MAVVAVVAVVLLSGCQGPDRVTVDNQCEFPVALWHEESAWVAVIGWHEVAPGASSYEHYLSPVDTDQGLSLGDANVVGLDEPVPIWSKDGSTHQGQVTVAAESCEVVAASAASVAVISPSGGTPEHPEVVITSFGPAGVSDQIGRSLVEAVDPLRSERTVVGSLGTRVRIPHGGFESIALARFTNAIEGAAPVGVEVLVCDAPECRSVEEFGAGHVFVSEGGDGRLHEPASGLQELGEGLLALAVVAGLGSLAVVVVRRAKRPSGRENQ
ncbi:MAG: hypothetical protein GY743_19400 [Planctomycetaceae bacterium]|nr:hypothetical protein [Planctomycetaceae bacterium]